MTITIEGVFTIATAIAASYTEFNAGTPVVIPEVDCTLGSQKVALDLTVTKRPEGSVVGSGITVTSALGLFGDFATFQTGGLVKLPELDVDLHSMIVGAQLSFKKA